MTGGSGNQAEGWALSSVAIVSCILDCFSTKTGIGSFWISDDWWFHKCWLEIWKYVCWNLTFLMLIWMSLTNYQIQSIRNEIFYKNEEKTI